jgi:DNA polymerase-3 subunit epsilon
MIKTLYFDLETTGLDPQKNSVTQFAAIVEYDGEEVDRIDIKFQPFEDAEIEEAALEKTGVSIEQLLSMQTHEEGFAAVKNFLDKHIDKYNRNDKFYAAGFNVRFDLEFLSAFFKYNGEKYGIGSYFNWRQIDPMYLLHLMDWKGKIKLQNYRLETVCEHFGVSLENAHDALGDIVATRNIIKKLL